MTGVLEIIGLILRISIVLGAVPIFLLYVVRTLAEQRRRLRELQARVELLEARAARAAQLTRAVIQGEDPTHG